MKKQSGFTLIELMVVMAIIAILATAGLAAYTGYIKKARDTTRIADLSALNTIVLADMASDGLPPDTLANLVIAIKAQNNNQLIKDPLTTGTTTTSTCAASGTAQECAYSYRVCDGGVGFALQAALESTSNATLLSGNQAGAGAASADHYEVGNCVSTNSTASPNTAFATIDGES